MFKAIGFWKACSVFADGMSICVLWELILSSKPIFPLDAHNWDALMGRAIFVGFFCLYGYIKARKEMIPVLPAKREGFAAGLKRMWTDPNY